MTEIKNEPHITDNEIANVQREVHCKRALWAAIFYQEAKEQGVDLENIMRKAIYKNGVANAKKISLYGKKDVTARDFGNYFFERGYNDVFEKKCGCDTPDKYTIELHYCPLVKQWADMGLSPEEIDLLCDIAMEGDRGEAETVGVNMELEKTIGRGDGVCCLTFTTKKGEEA